MPRAFTSRWKYERELGLNHWEKDAPTTLVRYELIERGAETLVRVSHSGFTDEAPRVDHGKGWVRVLAWLRGYVERPA